MTVPYSPPKCMFAYTVWDIQGYLVINKLLYDRQLPSFAGNTKGCYTVGRVVVVNICTCSEQLVDKIGMAPPRGPVQYTLIPLGPFWGGYAEVKCYLYKWGQTDVLESMVCEG